MTFFGELYLRSTLPFLSAEVTAQEVDYLRWAFEGLRIEGPLMDFGCGHGRHAVPLQHLLSRPVLGLELDRSSLALKPAELAAVRADLRRLPLAQGALAGGYAWYSTLFIFEDDAVHQALLEELRRAFKPGARFVFQTVPYEAFAKHPRASFERTLPDGSRLTESSQFDDTSGTDVGSRTLTLSDGRVLSGTYRIRYYRRDALVAMFEQAGFTLSWVHGGLDRAPLGPASRELILGLQAASDGYF